MEVVRRHGYQTGGLSNLRQVGVAFFAFAGDHDYELPGRVENANGVDRWPKVLSVYLQDVRVYAAPGDPKNYLNRKVDPLDNHTNNTSFIMNGYNDLGAFQDKSTVIRLSRVETPASTILFGTPKSGSIHFYMDFLEPPHGNNKDILDLAAYGDGSNYLFADGSARFIKMVDYKDALWLVDKSYVIPEM